MKQLLQAHSLTLKKEKMEIRSRLFMRSHQSNETAEPQQQSSIEELPTIGDSSSTDIPVTNSRWGVKGCQPSKALRWQQFVMKPIQPILSKRREAKTHACMQSRQIFHETKGNKAKPCFRWSFYNRWSSRGGRWCTGRVQRSWAQQAFWSITIHER